MSLISEESVCLRIGKFFDEGDLEYNCVGTGNVAVLLEWSV